MRWLMTLVIANLACFRADGQQAPDVYRVMFETNVLDPSTGDPSDPIILEVTRA